MVVLARFSAGVGEGQWLLCCGLSESIEDTFHFEEKLAGHVTREAVANQDALNHKVLRLGGIE